jgi:hypothetical protein
MYETVKALHVYKLKIDSETTSSSSSSSMDPQPAKQAGYG